jgi:hypothetical protein
MKKYLVLLSILAIAFNASSQGTITFTTYNTGNSVDAKVFNTDGTPLAGPSWFAQLYAAPGVNVPAAILQPGTPTTTFRTGLAAGYVNLTTVMFNNIPKDSAGYTVQMRVWDNSSGFYRNWSTAEPAWMAGLIKAAVSAPLSFTGKIGGDITSPPFLTGLPGFSIIIPEPSTMALAGVGISFLLISRRRGL